jgi:hypothetical protein
MASRDAEQVSDLAYSNALRWLRHETITPWRGSRPESGLNREHRDGPDPWAGVVRLVGGQLGWVAFSGDGTAEAVLPGSGQHRPYRFEVARDRETVAEQRPGAEPLPPVDDRWRSVERGERGRRARDAVAHLADAHGWTVVEVDRRGGSAGVSETDRRAIVATMRAAVEGGSTVDRAAEDAARAVGWSPRTALDLWRSTPRLVTIDGRRYKAIGRSGIRMSMALDDPAWRSVRDQLRDRRRVVIGP